MKKPIVILAACLLLGAGGIAYWQFTSSEREHVSTDTTLSTASSQRSAKRKPDEESYLVKITDSSIRWQVRVDMLRRLDADSLSDSDVDTLYGLLKKKPEVGQEENWWVVVNEIMEQMRLQGIGVDRYSEELLSIITDSEGDEVLRDYAVQHLGQWVTPRGSKLGAPYEQDVSKIQQTVETFGNLITDGSLAHTSIPGTTLMLLVDMHGHDDKSGVSSEILNPVIESLNPWMDSVISGNMQINKSLRISAINTVGMLGEAQHVQIIRQLAKSEDTDASIRLNSIAALGMIGDASDIESLKQLVDSGGKYHHAAKAAYKKLFAKFQ